jgi:drug/metabolite transporter (DMT)-like permease
MQHIWLALTPIMFLILWSAGYVVAKVALVDAAPMALLALRFAAVIAIMAVLFAILRPPLPKTLKDWLHLGLVGFLMQTVYFGMAYFAFVNGVAAGTAALIFSLQPLLVGLLAPRWSAETVSWPQWLGLAIAMTGTFVVIVAQLKIDPPPWWDSALPPWPWLGSPWPRFGKNALACRIIRSRQIWSAIARDCSDYYHFSPGPIFQR